MDGDSGVQNHIEDLVDEEHRLLELGGENGRGLNPEQHKRLRAIKVELDRLWDLLRQRRALRRAGLDPEAASERSADTVEHYLG
jgi:hypothetical protein